MSSANLNGRLNQHARVSAVGSILCLCGGSLGHAQLGIDQMKGVFSGVFSGRCDQGIRPFSIILPIPCRRDDPTARALEKHGLKLRGQGAELLNSI